jgi:hypothetical protein
MMSEDFLTPTISNDELIIPGFVTIGFGQSSAWFYALLTTVININF